MKRVFWLATSVALALLVIGCGSGDKGSAGEEAVTGAEEAVPTGIVLSPEAAETAGIETQGARRISMQAEILVPATLTNTSQGKAVVTPPVDGKITRLLVKIGEDVRTGQALAIVQSSDLAQMSGSVTQAERELVSALANERETRAVLDLANARLKTARAVLARQREFVQAGAFSQPALLTAQRDVSEAEADLNSAKQDQVVHEAQLERAEGLFKEQLISRSELEQTRLAVEQDKIRQQRAQHQVGIARATLEREQSIAARGLSNSREIQTAEAEVRASELEAQLAKIRLQTAGSGLAGAQKGVQAAKSSYMAQAGGGNASGGTVTIVAPIGGTVTELSVTLGQAVERTTEVCSIENLSSVVAIASVPENQIAAARRGATAHVRVSTYPGREFRGVVQVVGSRLDEKSRTMPVRVLVENPTGELRAGMFADVAIGVGPSDLVLAVPLSAITEEDEPGGAIVFVEGSKNRFLRRPVKLGRRQGGFVEILEGLEPGSKIVVKGSFVLMSESKKDELKGDED